MFRLTPIVFCISMLTATMCQVTHAQPRVAVWDPIKGTSERRFSLSPEHLNSVASWLAQADIQVTRLTAEQLNNKDTFSVDKFEALFMEGGTIPKISIKSMQRFADDGGVIVNLGARVPFLVYIKQNADKSWTMDPPTPKFAWQTNDLIRYLGIRYQYDVKRHNQGVQHSITPLFSRYFKAQVELPTGMLPSMWIAPNTEKDQTAEYFPLIRSQRIDQMDVIPQMFVSRFKGRISIHAIAGYYTGEEYVKWWDAAEPTVVAIAQLAHDIKHKVIKLDDYMHPVIAGDMPSPKPLQSRLADKAVQPARGKVIASWGQFNGSSRELAPPVNKTLTQPAKDMTQELGPGATVALTLPDTASQAQQLRVRLAYNKMSAGLQIRINGHTLLNQLFVYLDTGDSGNYSAPAYTDQPIEAHRLVYLPADIWQPTGNTLTLHNPGIEPVYFDAMQLETTPTTLRDWRMGLGGPWSHRRTANPPTVPAKYSKSWASMRCGANASYVGPPEDPQRFAIMDANMEHLLSINDNLEVNLQGTQQWSAIPNRYEEAAAMKRPYAAAADPQKYQQIVEHLVTKYGNRIDSYELWNEADSQKYWCGSVEEYIAWCHATIDTIKQLDPTARILTTGMAGFKSKFIHELARGGVMDRIDAMAFHPYAGKAPLWDLPYGLAEGELMALGINKPVYCNEMGFVYKNAEWFTAPPVFTPQLQAEMTDIAISRLISNDVTALSIFHAGGSTHYYGLIDENGVPRPAYKVFDDYLQLSHRGGKRIELSLTPASETDAPLQGIYVAASQHDDGSYTVIINPSMSNFAQRYVCVRIPIATVTTQLHCDIEDAQVTLDHAIGKNWAQIVMPVTKRTVIELKP